MNEVNDKGQKEIFTLKKIVFLYLRDKTKEKNLENQEFDIIVKNVKERELRTDKEEIAIEHARVFFDSQYNKISNDFSRILTTFGIDFFANLCKGEGKDYIFYEEEVEFLCELLFRYNNNSQVWKHLRNVNNDNYDGFVKIYEKTHSSELLQELEFVINGFTDMYARRKEKVENSIEFFSDMLAAYTQYEQIKFINDVENLLSNIPKLTKDDVEHSVFGIIRDDYGRYLQIIKNILSMVIEGGINAFNELRDGRKGELENMDVRENLGVSIQRIIRKMKEADPKLGVDFEEIYLGYEKECETNPTTKKQRLEQHKQNMAMGEYADEIMNIFGNIEKMGF